MLVGDDLVHEEQQRSAEQECGAREETATGFAADDFGCRSNRRQKQREDARRKHDAGAEAEHGRLRTRRNVPGEKER
jgi:hypothetical protein